MQLGGQDTALKLAGVGSEYAIVLYTLEEEERGKGGRGGGLVAATNGEERERKKSKIVILGVGRSLIWDLYCGYCKYLNSK